MFKLLSFSHLYLLFYFLAFEFVNVKYTSFHSISHLVVMLLLFHAMFIVGLPLIAFV